MLVACIASSAEIGVDVPDLVILPEYSNFAEIERVENALPHAVVVTAIEEDGLCRGYLRHRGRNLIEYLKIKTDGIGSWGTGIVPPPAVAHFADLSVGVVVCMDIQVTNYLDSVVNALRSAPSRFKCLCIPADMGGEWFQGGELMPPFGGVHVGLCNHPANHQYRCRSFIADPSRMKMVEQRDTEAIHLCIG